MNPIGFDKQLKMLNGSADGYAPCFLHAHFPPFFKRAPKQEILLAELDLNVIFPFSG
jgi:hypothetical protein